MENIEQELMKLEFQHKKDIVDAERRFNEHFDQMRISDKEMRAIQKQTETILKNTQAHLNHITKLVGISFEKFADIESRIENAADALHLKTKSK